MEMATAGCEARGVMPASDVVPLGEHCRRLSWAVQDVQGTSSGSSDWLQVAAGIAGVGVDLISLDPSVVLCGLAADYEDARGSVLSTFTTELIRFLMVWNALEGMLERFTLPRVPRSLKGRTSRIDRAVYLLTIAAWPLGRGAYDECLADLKATLESLRIAPLLGELHLRKWCGYYGMGLHLARKVRNRMVHGAHLLPEPRSNVEGYSGGESEDENLIRTAVRAMLLSCQALLLLTGPPERLTAATWLRLDSDTAEDGDIELQLALRVLHRRWYSSGDQLELDLPCRGRIGV